MRVRQWVVVGAVFTAAWAAGAGVALANGATGTVPGCETSPAPATGDEVDPCQAGVYVSAGDDCADPGTLTFYIDASGLEPGADYQLSFDSADFTGSGQTPAFNYDLVTDGSGAVEKIFDGTESADVRFPNGPFTLRFDLHGADGQVAYGAFTVDTCGAAESATPTTTEPTTPPTDTPSPTTSAPAVGGSTTMPTTTAAAATTDALVAAPAAEATMRPAALATTGTPMAATVLLGGGLLVAGTVALLAVRRRA